ncbi:hypothetical protein DAERI_130079 [Deinococcus aerius]|uniref:Uncharacterized protein n=1 Tax=Deinococcus aerius TaxID=200253 RepID=A0A2I9CYL5_9DEIO|nr:hypothetical protein DAERI_130079 [Deinococcus aerius]
MSGQEQGFSVEERVRWTTLALQRNLFQIRSCEEHHTQAVSVGAQLVASMLLWVTTLPLEEVLDELTLGPLSPSLRRRWGEMDFRRTYPEGFRVNLPKWRQALSRGQVEVVLQGGDGEVWGLRAWLNSSDGDRSEWEMGLDRARLEGIVNLLCAALSEWRTPPESRSLQSSSTAVERSVRRRRQRGRKSNSPEG